MIFFLLNFQMQEMPDLAQIFPNNQRKRFFKRTSSAQWDKMPETFKFK